MIPFRVLTWRNSEAIVVLTAATLENAVPYFSNETWANMSCKKVVSWFMAGLCVLPTVLVSAVPGTELSLAAYEDLIDTNFETLTSLGDSLSKLADDIMHLDDFKPEVVDPLHVTVEMLSDSYINPAASERGGYNEATNQFDLPAVDIYRKIDESISSILSKTVELPSEIWTTHDGPIVEKTFGDSLALLGTELTYGADDVRVPEQLFRWLFDVEVRETGIAVLHEDRFKNVIAAMHILNDRTIDTLTVIGDAYYLTQFGVEHPTSDGDATFGIFSLFKGDLEHAKKFWVSYLYHLDSIAGGLDDLQFSVFL